jgi:glucokinase
LGPDQILADLAELAKNLAGDRKISALGLGVPGLLDLEWGICVFSGNIRWANVPVVERLSNLLDCPVFIDNDVRVAALGELAQGQAQGLKDFIYLTVGTGIGSGIFIDGRLLRGPKFSAGEAGHMVLLKDGPACTCGSSGCLEALASATAIAREGRLVAEQNPASLLNSLSSNPGEIDATLVARAAQAGDSTACQVWDTAMAWLGIGVANLVNIFNPELVVIGGGVSLAGDQLTQPVLAQIQKLAMPVQRKHVRLAVSAMGDKAGVYGALELARQRMKGE